MTDKVMRSARTIAAKNRSDHSARIIRRRGEHHRPSTRCRRERDATQLAVPERPRSGVVPPIGQPLAGVRQLGRTFREEMGFSNAAAPAGVV